MADTTTPSLDVFNDVHFDGPLRAIFEGAWSDPSPLISVDLFASDGREITSIVPFIDATSGSWELAATLPRGQYDDLRVVAHDSDGNTFSTDADFTLQTGIQG